VEIIEKPKTFLSNHALTGMYIFDNRVVEIAKNVKPSDRGEIEITEIMNWYLKKEELDVEIINGQWIDAGTFESYYKANQWAYEKSQI
jgi:glucose-1-phosphate thymidylyltransferase